MTKIYKKNASALLFLTAISLTSCINNTLPEPATSTNAQNMSELATTSNFNWSTSQTVKVEITGLPTTIPIRSTITINGANCTYYTGMHLMSDTLQLTIETSTNEKELTLKFGALEYKSTIANNKAQFSFIPNN